MNETQCRSIVMERSGGLCEICGRQGESMHHRRLHGQGGPWTPSNVIRLCGDGTRRCHGKVTDTQGWRGVYEFLGWIVSAYEDWSEKPIFLTYGFVLLDDDGDYTYIQAAP